MPSGVPPKQKKKCNTKLNLIEVMVGKVYEGSLRLVEESLLSSDGCGVGMLYSGEYYTLIKLHNSIKMKAKWKEMETKQALRINGKEPERDTMNRVDIV